ncbi:MAG: hypothetical protein ABSD61_06285 [Terracidiphilus sp.]|jgi:hypothetical protein
MIGFDDPRWTQMDGGYRSPFDPRPLLKRLESEDGRDPIWNELWDELHHQGDVGEASFAAVPHIARICRDRGLLDWNVYAIVSIIELARGQGRNPDVPDWLKNDYFNAIRDLSKNGLSELPGAQDPELVLAILSVIAIEKGLRTHARFLVSYSDDEMLEMYPDGVG